MDEGTDSFTYEIRETETSGERHLRMERTEIMQPELQQRAGLMAKALFLFLVIDRGGIVDAAPGTLPPATQTYYQFTTIDIPASPLIFPNGINDHGLVSGTFADASWNYHGFLWQTGRVTIVNAPGWATTWLYGNNNAGLVAADYEDLIVAHACLYNVDAQTWTTLPDIPGKPANWTSGINNNGTAVGVASEGNPAWGSLSNGVAWIWDGVAYSLFTVPGATGREGTQAGGINDLGQICGRHMDNQGVRHGFLKCGAVITSFDVPGADGGTAFFTINNEGEVVGTCNAAGAYHGLIMRAGSFATLDVPGATDTGIYGINNRGDLVGTYWDASGRAHGFLATPERLSITNTGTNLLISWPVATVTFQLQSTPSLGDTISWSPVAQAAATNGSTVSVLVPASPGAAYFRLRRVP